MIINDPNNAFYLFEVRRNSFSLDTSFSICSRWKTGGRTMWGGRRRRRRWGRQSRSRWTILRSLMHLFHLIRAGGGSQGVCQPQTSWRIHGHQSWLAEGDCAWYCALVWSQASLQILHNDPKLWCPSSSWNMCCLVILSCCSGGGQWGWGWSRYRDASVGTCKASVSGILQPGFSFHSPHVLLSWICCDQTTNICSSFSTSLLKAARAWSVEGANCNLKSRPQYFEP